MGMIPNPTSHFPKYSGFNSAAIFGHSGARPIQGRYKGDNDDART